ncbi:MAG: FAD-binding oxidoreductase [Alphaproteobacteria bacterium]|nr:FAD-binding oxidoreductase [Alphaproteobacteria bacterium]
MAETVRCEVVIVGGGIAGASLGYRLAPHRRVIVLERETAPGYHSTGRSAAGLSENLGTRPIRALTALSRPFFKTPPQGFTDTPLLKRRPWVVVARADQRETFEAQLAEARASCPAIEVVDVDAAVTLFPLLNRAYVAQAFLEPEAANLDVDAILQGYLRGLRAQGGTLVTNAEALTAQRQRGVWRVETKAGSYEADVLVNASGAWADETARLAGVQPIGLVPKRRTAMIIAAPDGVDVSGWPELDDVSDEFYLKPEAGKLLLSPSDETPSQPTDAQPDEMDIAVAVDRIERATTLKVRRVERSWAGLRSFVPDRTPVFGFDPQAEGFFWLAGQGGAGIQTSAGLSQAAASLILETEWPALLTARGVTPATFSPARLRRTP